MFFSHGKEIGKPDDQAGADAHRDKRKAVSAIGLKHDFGEHGEYTTDDGPKSEHRDHELFENAATACGGRFLALWRIHSFLLRK